MCDEEKPYALSGGTNYKVTNISVTEISATLKIPSNIFILTSYMLASKNNVRRKKSDSHK